MAFAIVPIALAVPSPILRRLFVLEHRLHQLQDKDNQERTTALALAACGLCLGYPCPDGDLSAITARVAETIAPALDRAHLLGPITQQAYYLCLYGVPLPPKSTAPTPAASTPSEPPAQTEAQGTASPPSGGAHPSPLPPPPPGKLLGLVELYHKALSHKATEADRALYLQALASLNATGA